jgi:regulator of cell morphogenesis and NO signaling
MIAITEKTTVGEVARSFPASIRVMEQYGIDFCCGGGRHIGESCQEKGVRLDEFLDSVEKAQNSAANSESYDWASARLVQLIDHIVSRHHAYLKNELPHLSRMLAKVTDVHGARHGNSLFPLGKIYAAFRRELEDHMWKEESILFPLIQRMEEACISGQENSHLSVSGTIRVMEFEHRSAGNALDQMRRLTDEYRTPDDGCATYRALIQGLKDLEADLHQHIHLENNILFPRAMELET